MNSQFLHGDCQAILPTIPENSIDLMVTDPPYGMAFMGKQWDKAVPSVAIWQECLRVLKPGAFAFIMCIPRQDCLARMIVNLEDAGFVVGFSSLYWSYASGFPKAQNVGKSVDRRKGLEREVIKIEDTRSRYDGFDRKSSGRPHHESHLQEVSPGKVFITAPASPEAKALDGSYSGFQPKPALEIILVVMKPLSEKTYVDQALKNGKGVTWLDDGRIPTTEVKPNTSFTKTKSLFQQSKMGFPRSTGSGTNQPQGRFPANLLVSDDSLNDGKTYSTHGGGTRGSPSWWRKSGSPRFLEETTGKWGEDSGSFSRYFSLDSWWTERIKSLPESVQKTFPSLIVPKPAQSEKTVNGQVECTHPTVKPVKLMSYLVTLGSREGDIVLDPFSGHGTTAAACKLLDRHYLAIEQEQESFENAKRRVGLTAPPPQLALCF